MNDKLILEQNKGEILTIIEALHFFKENVIKPENKPIIDKQILKIANQIKKQNINVYVRNYKSKLNFGDVIKYKNNKAIFTGLSNKDGFIKIAIGNELKIIEVPITLITKEE
ncbi:MAG: hypothetical protein ACOCP8_01720 [archaeon]